VTPCRGKGGPAPSRARSRKEGEAAASGGVALVTALVWVLLLPAPAEAQVTWRDFVITGGLSSEGYQGNLPSVGVAIRDSTEFASAIIGEFGVRGDLLLPVGGSGRATLQFDGGLRQFSARGFELRDFAPREWVGTLDAGYSHAVSPTVGLGARVRVRGREVHDRPPMPIYLQPGYRSVAAAITADLVDDGGRRWDVDARGEWADFLAPAFAPQIRLLDRRSVGAEIGVRPDWDTEGDFRFHVALELSRYPEQETFEPSDPTRRDRTFVGGVSWTWSGPFLAQIAAEGRANRSNSLRPEYDSATLRGMLSVSLPADVAVTGYLALTGKRYRFPTEFARLIPGEEANSASQSYLSFNRGLARNLDGTLRLGWTRAETEIGDDFFQRFGASFLLNYRPGF
jgi:hypothetical protein